MQTASFEERDCGTRRTLTGTAATVASVRRKVSGVSKTLEARTVIKAESPMTVAALTPAAVEETSGVILVPGRSGAKVLRIERGIPHCIKACRVFGCRTLAPRSARSEASR